jgi:hypothetical protein
MRGVTRRIHAPRPAGRLSAVRIGYPADSSPPHGESLSLRDQRKRRKEVAPAHPCARDISTSLYVRPPLCRFSPAPSLGTSMCLALRAACGCANRQSCRFVIPVGSGRLAVPGPAAGWRVLRLPVPDAVYRAHPCARARHPIGPLLPPLQCSARHKGMRTTIYELI